MATSTTTRQHQLELLTTATNRNAGWTEAEVEFLRECADLPAVEVAEALDRTLFAIYNAREALAKGTIGGTVRSHERRTPVRHHHRMDRAVCIDCGLDPCDC